MSNPTSITVLDGNGAAQTVSTLDGAVAVLKNGAQPSAASVSSVTATDDPLIGQIGIVTETAPASDTASSGLNGRLQRIAQRITSLVTAFPAALGPTTKAGALSVTTATDDPLIGQTGIVTETAPATDTASSGLNGRLQRLAQRLTALIAQVPAALGQTTMSGSMSMTIASDQSNVPVTGVSRAFAIAGTTLTRPANTTAYAAGDSISDNATAASVTALPVTVSDVNDAPVVITEIHLDTNDTGLAAGSVIEVFLFNSDPTASTGVGGGDNAAYSNKKAGFVARFLGTFVAFSDGGRATCIPEDGQAIVVARPETGGKRLWVQYKTVSGFTPSANSTTITPVFKGFQGRA